MSSQIEQEKIAQTIHKKTERKITVPVVSSLYELYKSTGCVEALATLVEMMPEADREPLIHTLGSHVTKEKPVFIYAISEAAGIEQAKSALLAASIDMLWALSLIVDDIEDNDTVRAGQESAWVKFGKHQAMDCVESGVQVVQMDLEENFGKEAWFIMNGYIQKALVSVNQHKSLDIDVTLDCLNLNYVYRNDFYCSAPAEIIYLTSTQPAYYIAASALRKVTIAGQVLNDLKDIWPQYNHIRPSFSDIRNHLVTLPIKQMYENLNDHQRTEFLSLWNETPSLPEHMEDIAAIIKKSGIKEPVVRNIRQTYLESKLEFESIVQNPNFRAIFNQWVSYKFGQCESLK